MKQLLSDLMKRTHCKSCKKVAKQLKDVISTRRRGQPFEVPDPDESSSTPILTIFGTVGEISKRKNCLSCSDLSKEFTRWEATDDWTRDDNLAVGVGIDFSPSYPTLEPQQQSLYLLVIDPAKGYGRSYLENLYLLEKGAPHDECGRVIDRHEVSFELIKGWLHCCDSTHGEQCTTSRLTNRLAPDARPSKLLLVDLERYCLFYGTLTDKYAALSYVWGQVNTLRTTNANIQDFLKPGSLDFVNGDLHIPQTVRDFMRLAVRLGIRYAWVDSLCIVQDGSDLQQQLNGMAAIFCSAYLTIVSEGPDADSGIIGVGGGGKPRDRPSYMLRLPDMTCVLDDNTIAPNDPQIWQQRAWTFQEGLFSRRLLAFDIFGIVSWVCPRHIWAEIEQRPSEALDWVSRGPAEGSIDWRYLGLSKLNFTWPDMRRWCELIEEYASRELSFATDGMNAIAGLISVMETVSQGGFFYGLPELFFDTFLLWDVAEDRTMERREASRLPSWSFFGWETGPLAGLDLFWWRFSMDHLFLDDPEHGYGSDCQIGSIVDWYKESHTSSLVQIANQFHICRSQWAEQPPDGWTKHYPKGKGEAFFMHDSIDDYQKFRYPITLPQTGASSNNDGFSGRLRFKAKRGWLKIADLVEPGTGRESEYESDSEGLSATNVSLVDDLGAWCGIIRLPQREVYGFTLPDIVEKKAPLELIAVATGKVANDSFPKHSDTHGSYRRDIPEWDCEERPKDTPVYLFYFVLCIEWREGIAKRRGLGRVEKAAWERLPLEEIDVVLE